MESYYWLILMAIMLVIEIITLGLTTIWFAAGALVSYVAALFGANLIAQIIIFMAVSIIALIFTRPIAVRFFNSKDREKTNVDSLIGKNAKVIEKIDNENSKGKVSVNGMEWTARSVDESIIEAEEIVTVKEVSGVKLLCERMG